jgi:hypothetical protein
MNVKPGGQEFAADGVLTCLGSEHEAFMLLTSVTRQDGQKSGEYLAKGASLAILACTYTISVKE